MDQKTDAGDNQHHHQRQTIEIEIKPRRKLPNRHPHPDFLYEIVLARRQKLGGDQHCTQEGKSHRTGTDDGNDFPRQRATGQHQA